MIWAFKLILPPPILVNAKLPIFSSCPILSASLPIFSYFTGVVCCKSVDHKVVFSLP